LALTIPTWRGDDMTLPDLIAKYIADPRYLSTARSKETYEHCLRQFLTYLVTEAKADTGLRQFTPEHVEGFVGWLYRHEMVNSSVNLRLSALSGLAKYGMQQRLRGKPLIDANPVDFVKRPKNARPKEKYLTAVEIRALLATDCPANERLALALLFDTQLRVSAAVNAKVKDLRLDGDSVRLSVVEKGDNPDTFLLSPDVAAALCASLKEREAGPEETLLVNTRGEAYTRQTLSEAVARVARRAGVTRVRVGAHLFARHSPASLAGQDGASEFEIAAMLRHRSTATAKRYVHGVVAETARDRVRGLLNGG
jgi:site-specific recombinase XerD